MPTGKPSGPGYVAAAQTVLRGRGNYVRTGNATYKFVEIDGHVVWRLKRLLVKREGRNLRAGEAERWTPNGSSGSGFIS